MKGAVTDIGETELIRRAISNAAISPRTRTAQRKPLWSKVSDIFSLGSTYSRQLCDMHGFNPDKEVRP